MTSLEIKNLLNSESYSFLRTDENLGENICLLVLGGSMAYGTNTATSDIDIRGISTNSPKQIYGLEPDFEQVVNTKADTVIYSLNKMINLLISCNPNAIEILGCRPEDYLYINEFGKLIIENKTNFLSVKAIDTFGGYARAQFNRLEHALLGNGDLDDKKLEMLKHSLDCDIEAFNIKHSGNPVNLKITILSEEETVEILKERLHKSKQSLEEKLTADLAEATTPSKIQSLNALYENNLKSLEEKYEHAINNPNDNIDDRIILTGNLNSMPINQIQSILRELHKIKSEYGNINKRNTKKDSNHLAKHMMHLIRLYKMGTKLNESLDIHTHWDGKDQEMLMDIRNMKYMTPDGKGVLPEFYDLLQEVEKEYDYSTKHTILPLEPNIEAINEMLNIIYTNTFSKGDKQWNK